MSHPNRRRILTLLGDHTARSGDEFTVEELAGEDADLERFTTALYHVHLPKLAEPGYIDWDREDDVIRHGPRYDEIAPLVTLMRDHADELPDGWP